VENGLKKGSGTRMLSFRLEGRGLHMEGLGTCKGGAHARVGAYARVGARTRVWVHQYMQGLGPYKGMHVFSGIYRKV
jgi:hypothetical protein